MNAFDQIELSLQQQYEQAKRAIEDWQREKDLFLPIITELELLGLEPAWDGELNLRFSGDAAKLAAVVRVLRRGGWEFRDSRPAANQPEWCGRMYREGTPSVWIFFTSTVCRRVQVGTQTVEQPIYETICE
jgi:hypothetical protein